MVMVPSLSRGAWMVAVPVLEVVIEPVPATWIRLPKALPIWPSPVIAKLELMFSVAGVVPPKRTIVFVPPLQVVGVLSVRVLLAVALAVLSIVSGAPPRLSEGTVSAIVVVPPLNVVLAAKLAEPLTGGVPVPPRLTLLPLPVVVKVGTETSLLTVKRAPSPRRSTVWGVNVSPEPTVRVPQHPPTAIVPLPVIDMGAAGEADCSEPFRSSNVAPPATL